LKKQQLQYKKQIDTLEEELQREKTEGSLVRSTLETDRKM
jgi:hypothetical protein